ncbi:MAG TPA: serine hydrolase domain-containing protein [Candidatus Limnocylindria bacterium]|nr:serine hydrolase domain-containing protein [Candidatus Limnocylindria bacterium]
MARRTTLLVTRLLLGGLISFTTLVPPALASGPGARGLDDDPIPTFWLIPARVAARVAARPVLPAATEQSSLQAALDHARTVAGCYGLTVAIVRDDGVQWAGATGVERDATTPLGTDEPFVIGSVTKTFVTAALLRLVHRGSLSLDDQVTDWLPSVAVARGVTVRDLLAHTSGIADLYPPLKATLFGEPEHVFTHEEVLGQLGAAWFAPGTAWGYSNTNFVIAGMLLEKVTGRPAEDVLSRELIAPAGLRSTWLLAGSHAEPALLPPSWATSFWTSGAMRSTVADLARWGAALYGGHIVSGDDLAAMTTFNDDDYGLGTRRFPFGSEEAIGHSGLLGTTTSILLYFPEQRVSVAAIANRAEVDLPAALVAEDRGRPSILELALGPGADLAAPSASPSPSPAVP